MLLCWKVRGGGWNLYDLGKAFVYDMDSGSSAQVEVANGILQVEVTEPAVWRLADLTDENWRKGYSEAGKILLFNRQEELLADLQQKKKIVCEDAVYQIVNVDYDEQWIRVEVDREAAGCMYPADIRIE